MKSSLRHAQPLWLAAALVFAAASCSPESGDWRAAKVKPSAAAYQRFLEKYPGGRFAAEARQLLEDWEFRDASAAKDLAAYRSFLQRHPSGRFAAAARQAVEALDWKAAVSAVSFKSMKEYLSAHADGAHAGEAGARLEALKSGRSPEFADVRTMAVTVRQEFVDDFKNVTLDFQGPLSAFYPYFGIEAAPAGTIADAAVAVRAEAEALSASYSPTGLGDGTTYYTGARVSGSMVLAAGDRRRLEETFEGEVPPPPSTVPGRPEPRDAPFDEALTNDFPRRAAALLARAFGYAPLAGALGSGTDGVRQAAAWAMENGGPAALRALAGAVKEDDAGVRLLAAEALRGHKNAESVSLLAGCLESEGDANKALRDTAASSLARIGAPAVPALEADSQDARAWVREAAAKALGGIPSAKSVSLLAPLLDDAAPAVRLAAISALGDHRSAQAMGLLIGRLAAPNEADRGPWLEAVRKAVPGAADSTAADEPEQSLTWTADLAARLVEVIPLLEAQPQLRTRLAETLSLIGSPALAPLGGALKSDAVSVRRCAASAVAGMTDDTAGPLRALKTAVGDPDREVRLTVAQGLAKISDEGAIEPLAKLFADTDAGIRAAALEGLNQAPSFSDSRKEFRRVAGSAGFLAALVAEMDVKDPAKTSGRDAASAVLGRIGAPTFDLLAPCLKSANRLLREGAVSALGAAGDDRSLAALLAFGEAPEVRSDTVMMSRLCAALGAGKNPKASDFLVRGLAEGQEGSLRNAAAEALGDLGDVRAVDALVRALGRDKAGLDTTIGEAIRKLTDYTPEETDFDWKTWWAENRKDYIKRRP